jgi:hypothetical protein
VAKPNWNKIRNEYVSTNISQRKLSEKYKVSFNTLKDRAKRENWTKCKDETHHRITTKTLQKTAEKVAESDSDIHCDVELFLRKAQKRANELIDEAGAGEFKSIVDGMKGVCDIRKSQSKGIDDSFKIEIITLPPDEVKPDEV